MQQLLDKLILKGINEGNFPSAVAAVGCKDRVFAVSTFGKTEGKDSTPVDKNTLYDMASCTKIMSTTMLALISLEKGELTLYDTVGSYLEAPETHRDITIKELMIHTSGLLPTVRLDKLCKSSEEVVETIFFLPTTERGKADYSCLGFIILGKILEKIYGDTLDVLAKNMVFEPLNMKNTCYCPKGGNIASTEIDPTTGKAINGVVHDENARFMGGVAGNAGVFSNIGDCTLYLSMLSQKGQGFISEAMLNKAIINYTKEEQRGLGFALAGGEASFFGDIMPDCSFGHTGFTGTSLVVDPSSGFFVALLTNRVYPSRTNRTHMRFRRVFHNALYSEFVKRYK